MPKAITVRELMRALDEYEGGTLVMMVDVNNSFDPCVALSVKEGHNDDVIIVGEL